MQPGQSLNVVAEIIKHGDDTTLLKATGKKQDSMAVSARLVLKRSFIEGGNELSYADRYASNFMRELTPKIDASSGSRLSRGLEPVDLTPSTD